MSDFNDFLSGLDNDAKIAAEAEKERKRKSEEAELKRKEERRAEEERIRSGLSAHYKIAEEFKAMAKQAEAVVVKNQNLKKQFYFDTKLFSVGSRNEICLTFFDPDFQSTYTESRKLLDRLCGNIYNSCYEELQIEANKCMEKWDMLCILFLVCGSDDQFLHKDLIDRKKDHIVELTKTPLMVMGRNNPEKYFLCRIIEYFIYDYCEDRYTSFGYRGLPDTYCERKRNDFEFTYYHIDRLKRYTEEFEKNKADFSELTNVIITKISEYERIIYSDPKLLKTFYEDNPEGKPFGGDTYKYDCPSTVMRDTICNAIYQECIDKGYTVYDIICVMYLIRMGNGGSNIPISITLRAKKSNRSRGALTLATGISLGSGFNTMRHRLESKSDYSVNTEFLCHIMYHFYICYEKRATYTETGLFSSKVDYKFRFTYAKDKL